MQVVELKCFSCGAPIADAGRDKGIIVCPYCGSTHYIKGQIGEPETVGGIRVPLCCVAKDLEDNATLKTVINGMSSILDEKQSSDSLIPVIDEILKDKKEAATKQSFPKDYAKANSIIQDIMLDGEELIFYKTAALLGINKLKTGMFVTTERVGYIDGKKVFWAEYKNLEAMVIDIVFSDTTYWYPNGDENIFMSGMAVSHKEFGAIIAYVVLRAYEKSNRQKSVVLKMK